MAIISYLSGSYGEVYRADLNSTVSSILYTRVFHLTFCCLQELSASNDSSGLGCYYFVNVTENYSMAGSCCEEVHGPRYIRRRACSVQKRSTKFQTSQLMALFNGLNDLFFKNKGIASGCLCRLK